MRRAGPRRHRRGDTGDSRGDGEEEAEQRDERGSREKGLGEEAVGERERVGGMGKSGGGDVPPPSPFLIPSVLFPSFQTNLLRVAARGGSGRCPHPPFPRRVPPPAKAPF